MSTQVGQMLKREFANRRRTGGGRLSSLCPQMEPSSNVVHRTCLPSSAAIRLELQIGLSLMDGVISLDSRTSASLIRRLWPSRRSYGRTLASSLAYDRTTSG